jgi:MoxR-like ATPase
LLYGTLARYQRELRGLLVEFKVSNAQEAFAMLARVAGVDEREVAEALRAGSRLERIGMVENLISEHNITDLMKVSEQLPPVLMREYRDPSDLMAVFTRPAPHASLDTADFAFVADEVRVLSALLRNAVAQKACGVNVLLYGPPGTGKTELARVCAQAAGLELYEVEYADRDGNSLTGRDRYRSLQISQVFLKGSAHVALLFDEVEDVFPAIPSDTAQLMARVSRALAGTAVSEGFAARLAARRGLTPAQIRTAVRFAGLAGPMDDAEALIERQLAHADRALGHSGSRERGARVWATRYDLGLLHVESHFAVPQIVAALQPRSHGALCFFGPPGTGKTALAEHIAVALGRPLLVRQASDIVSKFVGETEQNMARMFDEAAAEEAVLLLDEADSFLRSRRLAERHYEVSEVNEMLQGMERNACVFICTTNLFEDLDEAALRRFTFKIRFKALRPEQRGRCSSPRRWARPSRRTSSSPSSRASTA